MGHEFNRRRRMFAAAPDGTVLVAPVGMDAGHEEWFTGLLGTSGAAFAIHMWVRGYCLDGEMYLYVGKEFDAVVRRPGSVEVAEAVARHLGLPGSTAVYSGAERGPAGQKWPGREYWGSLEELRDQ